MPHFSLQNPFPNETRLKRQVCRLSVCKLQQCRLAFRATTFSQPCRRIFFRASPGPSQYRRPPPPALFCTPSRKRPSVLEVLLRFRMRSCYLFLGFFLL